MRFKDIENFHQAVMQMTPACVVSLDDTGMILDCRSYLDRISRQDTASFIGQPWSQVFIPEKQEGLPAAFFKETGFQNPKETPLPKILTAFEERVFMEWTFQKIQGAGAGADGILGVGVDITRHIELERQIQHVDRLATVGQLAAGVAHELNGPLNNILGYAQLSAKQQDLPEQVYQDLDNIVRFSLHAREIVRKVMLFSRQVPPGHEAVDLNRVVKDSLYLTEPFCSKKQIRVNCDFELGLPAIRGDFSQLRQVVVNLVINAAQAISAPQGRITIQTFSEGNGTVTMTVKDNGAGMSADILEQCFIPFFTTKDVDQGTGLGLAVVHGIIKSHDGAITAESSPAKGACFKLVFPVHPQKGEQDA